MKKFLKINLTYCLLLTLELLTLTCQQTRNTSYENNTKDYSFCFRLYNWNINLSGRNDMNKVTYTNVLMRRLMAYSERYEISFQMWPKQYTIYVAKDGVDLFSFGGHCTPDQAMERVLEYLDRINKAQ